jgi:hypothetical protein
MRKEAEIEEKRNYMELLIKEQKTTKEINDALRAKFGRGASNSLIKTIRDKLICTEINYKITQIELEEVKAVRQYETRRLRIVATVLPNQTTLDVLAELKTHLAEGFSFLQLMDEKLNKFNEIKGRLISGKIACSDQNEAKEAMALLYKDIKELKTKFKTMGLEAN